MSGQTMRDEMHEFINNLDEANLKLAYSRLMNNEKIVGYRPGGTPISLGDLKETIRQSRVEIAKGDFMEIDDFEKESETW